MLLSYLNLPTYPQFFIHSVFIKDWHYALGIESLRRHSAGSQGANSALLGFKFCANSNWLLMVHYTEDFEIIFRLNNNNNVRVD